MLGIACALSSSHSLTNSFIPSKSYFEASICVCILCACAVCLIILCEAVVLKVHYTLHVDTRSSAPAHAQHITFILVNSACHVYTLVHAMCTH